MNQSKIVEKIVALQLTTYLEAHNLLPTIQSGFRKGYSTETLLLCLPSDVLGAVDHCQLTLLALFDISAAFDTVDHSFIHSFILAISIAPLQVLYHSEALPT